MKLNKEQLINEARTCGSLEELGIRLGVLQGDYTEEALERFHDAVYELEPDIDVLMERCEVEREHKLAVTAEDVSSRRELGQRLRELTIQCLDLGFGIPMALAAPKATKASEERPVRQKKSKPVVEARKVEASKDGDVLEQLSGHKRGCRFTAEGVEELRRVLVPVPKEEFDCEHLFGDLLGRLGGDVGGLSAQYRGRPVVCFLQRSDAFGAGVPAVERKFIGEDQKELFMVRVFTLHNGILNHCDISEEPTPYWAIIDAMSDLKKFSKAEAIAHAVKLHGVGDLKVFESGCDVAYNVLKTAHAHPRKKATGMSHMVVGCGVGPDKGKSEIRGRKAHETLEYFEEYKSKLIASRETGQAVVSLENRAV